MTVREILATLPSSRLAPARSSPEGAGRQRQRSNAPMACSTFPRLATAAIPERYRIPLAEPRLEGELQFLPRPHSSHRYVEEYQ